MVVQIENTRNMEKLNAHIPDGPLALKWTKYKASVKLVNPANKRKIDIIAVSYTHLDVYKRQVMGMLKGPRGTVVSIKLSLIHI